MIEDRKINSVENNENDILQTAVEYMDTFLDRANNIVSEFRKGKYTQMAELGNLFDGFQWIYIAVNRINTEYDAKIEIDNDRFKETIKTIEEALLNSDIVLLTDVIEYEVIEMVQEWFGDK